MSSNLKFGLGLAGLAFVSILGACGGDDGGGGATGPGAALQCDSSGKNAFDTYGIDAFVAVNSGVFDATLSELGANGTTNLGDSFNQIGMNGHDDLDTFKGKLAAFLVFVYGGPDHITFTDGVDYDGVQDMDAAHDGLNITDDQYNYFVSNIIVPVLTGAGVPDGSDGGDDDVSSCFAPPILDGDFIASVTNH